MQRRDALKTMGVGSVALASLDGNALRTFAEETPTKTPWKLSISNGNICYRIPFNNNRVWVIESQTGADIIWRCVWGEGLTISTPHRKFRFTHKPQEKKVMMEILPMRDKSHRFLAPEEWPIPIYEDMDENTRPLLFLFSVRTTPRT